MQVELAKENEDGSAVFTFDMTPEEVKAFVLLGIKTAIMMGIEESKKWDGDSDIEGLRDGDADLQNNAGLSD